MNNEWQVPIRSQESGKNKSWISHYFEQSDDTHRQVHTLCLMLVTPGFATLDIDVNTHAITRCKHCMIKLHTTKL